MALTAYTVDNNIQQLTTSQLEIAKRIVPVSSSFTEVMGETRG